MSVLGAECTKGAATIVIIGDGLITPCNWVCLGF